MLRLFLGNSEVVIPDTGFFYLDDEVLEVPESRVFDPKRDSLNPIQETNYRSNAEFVDIIDALFSRGDSTLTKDTGLDFIFDCLERKPKTLEMLIPKPDKKSTPGHVWAYGKIQRILRSPILRQMLCNRTNFKFTSVRAGKPAKVFARLNRMELGDWDCLTAGLFLISHYKGQIITDAFYLRPFHINLVRENRLIVKCNTLSELPEELRNSLLPYTVASGVIYEDAVTLARQARLIPNTNEFNDYVSSAVSQS